MVSIFIFVPALLILMTHSQSNMTTTAMTTQPPKLTMDTMNTSLPSEIDLCIGPLIHTDLDNPVSQQGILTVNFCKLICIRQFVLVIFTEPMMINLINITGIDMIVTVSMAECGLACSSGGEIYGLTDEEQDIVDLCKIIGCSLCFVAILFLGFIQCINQKRGGKKLCNKPILQILPYLITFSLFSIVFLMTVGEMVGKDAIVCLEHDYGDYPGEEEKELSFFNPIQGQNIACTVHGLFFYSALNMYQFYTVLLSFIIFRQLYRPMRPLWNIRQRWWHVIVWSMIIILDILTIVMSSHGGVYPMGVCIPGPSVKWELFAFVNLPFITSCTLCVILLIASSILLRREVAKQKDVTKQTGRMEDLSHRLIYYSIGVIACLILLCITGLGFFIKHDSLRAGMDKSIQCQLEQTLTGGTASCPERSDNTKVSPFFFISWVVAAILGVSSQLILSCHTEARDRLKRVTTLDKHSFKIVVDKTTSTTSSGSSKQTSEKKKILVRATSSPDDDARDSSMPHFDQKSKGVVSITPSDIEYRTSVASQEIELEAVNETDNNL